MWQKRLGPLTAYILTYGLVGVFLATIAAGVLFVSFMLGGFALAAEQPEQNARCLTCHGQQTLKVTRNGQEVSLYVDAAVYRNSVHAALPCTSCHPGFDKVPHQKPITDLALANEVTASCAACHAQQAADYEASIHGKIKETAPNTARCADCHGSHDIQRQEARTALHNRLNSPAVCMKCHQGEEAASYQWSFHGSANRLGYTKSATCTDCHSAHKILPASDPASTVSRENLPQTCTKCHSGPAHLNWAQGYEHITNRSKDKAFWVWLVWKLFLVLILIDVFKDLPIILLDLLKQWRNAGKKADLRVPGSGFSA